MAVTVTGEQILQEVLRRGGGSGRTPKVGMGFTLLNAEIGAIAAGTITSVLHLITGQMGTDAYMDAGLARPGNATGIADYWRLISTTTAAGVASINSNWSDTTLGAENVYYFRQGLTLRGFLDALLMSMRETYFSTLEPLSTKPTGTTLADASFQSTATTNYVESDADGGAATTFSKVTTSDSENVYPGMLASGRILNAAAGGYIRHRFAVTEGEQVMAWALTRLASGTNFEHVLRDVDGSAAIGTTVEHNEGAWMWSKRQESIPTGCEILEARYQGEGTTDDIFINAAQVLFPSRATTILDTHWDTSYKATRLVYYEMGGTSITTNTWPAMAAKLRPIDPADYDLNITRPGANVGYVHFHNNAQEHWFQYPVFIQGRRAYSDLTTFTLALTGTTAADLDLIAAKTMRTWLLQEAASLDDADDLLRKANRWLTACEGKVGQTEPAQVKEQWSMGGLAN